MKVQAALVKEQGVTFAVIVVKQHVVASVAQAQEAIAGFSRFWPSTPIVLMSQDGRGRPTYRGRPDIVRFLAKVPFQLLPWREWEVA
jgi:hypothetical protein